MAGNVALCRVEREQNDFTEYRTRINFSLFKLNSADQRVVAQKTAIDIECNIMSLFVFCPFPSSLKSRTQKWCKSEWFKYVALINK